MRQPPATTERPMTARARRPRRRERRTFITGSPAQADLRRS
jgi:hypothetical protein